MPKVKDVLEFLTRIAPMDMKMNFDNIGLLVGWESSDVKRMIVSLDITRDVIAEAIEEEAELIVSHHPLFFSLKSVTDRDITGAKVAKMLRNGISAICMHTNLDAARYGVNDALAAACGIADYTSSDSDLLNVEGHLSSGEPYSYGRLGNIEKPISLAEYLDRLKKSLDANGLRYYDAGRDVHKIAVVGGSGGSDLIHAIKNNCDTFVTSDVKYDVFLDAKENCINLIDGGHYCTENLVIKPLADKLNCEFPVIDISVSKRHGQIIKFC